MSIGGKNVIDLALDGVLIQRADPEGIVIKSEEELSPLVALRRAYPRKTTTVHGNLKQALEAGDEGYELEPGAKPAADAGVTIATKADVDGA